MSKYTSKRDWRDCHLFRKWWWSQKFRWMLKRVLSSLGKPHWFDWYVIKTFKPALEYGEACRFDGDYTDEGSVEVTKSILRESMSLYIPGQFQLKVEYRATMPMDYGRVQAIAWYYFSTNKGTYAHKYLEFNESDGFYWV